MAGTSSDVNLTSGSQSAGHIAMNLSSEVGSGTPRTPNITVLLPCLEALELDSGIGLFIQ